MSVSERIYRGSKNLERKQIVLNSGALEGHLRTIFALNSEAVYFTGQTLQLCIVTVLCTASCKIKELY